MDSLAVGSAVPLRELENQFGESVRLVEPGLPGVIVFFPFSFSSVCSGELGTLQRNLPLFQESGVRLLAVSTDHKYALRAFAQAENLSFDLLADFWPHGAVSSAFGAFDADRGFALRRTFFIDGERMLRAVVTSAPGEARNFKEYEKALEVLREGVSG